MNIFLESGIPNITLVTFFSIVTDICYFISKLKPTPIDRPLLRRSNRPPGDCQVGSNADASMEHIENRLGRFNIVL